VPTLRSDDIAVMNDLRVHRAAGVHEAITVVGARLLYPTPCSPNLKAIEHVVSKFRRLLRSASAGTVEVMWLMRGELLERFTETECRNRFKHCCYCYA